jgi:hypothetical protein
MWPRIIHAVSIVEQGLLASVFFFFFLAKKCPLQQVRVVPYRNKPTSVHPPTLFRQKRKHCCWPAFEECYKIAVNVIINCVLKSVK